MIIYCQICGKENYFKPSSIKIGRGKFCSRECYYKSRKGVSVSPQTQFKSGPRPGLRKGKYKKCEWENCENQIWVIPSKGARKKYCSKECFDLAQTGIKDEKHRNWKGNNVGYSGLHMWVRIHLGTPDTCEHCGKSGFKGKEIHWANKSGEYKRDLSDWLRLCSSCHSYYDQKSPNAAFKKYGRRSYY